MNHRFQKRGITAVVKICPLRQTRRSSPEVGKRERMFTQGTRGSSVCKHIHLIFGNECGALFKKRNLEKGAASINTV